MLRFEDLDNFFTQPADHGSPSCRTSSCSSCGSCSGSRWDNEQYHDDRGRRTRCPRRLIAVGAAAGTKAQPKDLLAAKRLVNNRATALQDRFTSAAKGSLVKADALICKLGLEDF